MSDFQGICSLISVFFITVIVPFFFDTPPGQKLKKKISRKLHTIHLKRKREKIFEKKLHLNHIEYRLRNEYNVRVLYELYEESDISADFDRYSIRIVNCDTNELRWSRLIRQMNINDAMSNVMEQLDKGSMWEMIWC